MDLQNRSPKILLVGDFLWFWYQEACAQALENIGCSVIRFGWTEDFRYWVSNKSEPVYHSFLHRLQYRFRMGPTVYKINKRLIEVALREQPDIIWFYNVQLIKPWSVVFLKKMLINTIFCQYANDNPFSGNTGFWKYYLNSIPCFDLHFCYRKKNVEDHRQYGANHVYLLRSYFLPDVDCPISLELIPESFHCDVVFAGHFEDDGRVACLEAICRAGYRLKIYGGGWDAALPLLSKTSPLRDQYPIAPATGKNYQFAICGAKVALCFLSTLNEDAYTRRNFQIPAMKTAMLSQFSDELAGMFETDKEIMFFTNQAELISKVKILLENDEIRASIAELGYRRVYQDGHDVHARMQNWLNTVLTHKMDNYIRS